MQRPNPHIGMRHIALFCKNFAACKHFYSELLGMKIVWEPDDKNCYLSSGSDNVALHLAPENFSPGKDQHLDHLGFFLTTNDDVDAWYNFLSEAGVEIKAQPKNHRDGTRSFYCADPDGNMVQMIYYPL